MKKSLVLFLLCLIFIFPAVFFIVRIDTYYAYFYFRNLGADVKKIGFYIDDRVSAEINVEKDNKLYTIVFRYIHRKNFFNNSLVVIESINGYGIWQCYCKPLEHTSINLNIDNKRVGYSGFTNHIYISYGSFFYEFFEIEESSIAWIINNIDKIEEKFMQIPTDCFSYYKAPTGLESYLKRKKFDVDFKNYYRDMKPDKALNDTVFVFGDTDCNRHRL